MTWRDGGVEISQNDLQDIAVPILHKSVLIKRNRYATSPPCRCNGSESRWWSVCKQNEENAPKRSMLRRVHVADRCPDYWVLDRGGQLFDNLCFLKCFKVAKQLQNINNAEHTATTIDVNANYIWGIPCQVDHPFCEVSWISFILLELEQFNE